MVPFKPLSLLIARTISNIFILCIHSRQRIQFFHSILLWLELASIPNLTPSSKQK